MTTLASPTLGATCGLSLWRVEMSAGAQGPPHSFDSEQLWTVLAGEVAVSVDGERTELAPGDTVVIPAEAQRRISALSDVRLLVCGQGDAVARAAGESKTRGTPPWIA